MILEFEKKKRALYMKIKPDHTIDFNKAPCASKMRR